MQGYKTIIVAALALTWSVLGSIGVEVPASDQASISTGLIAAIMLGMRFITKTPIGKSS